eukprot:1800986-Lingulodinium_polyedra.AAC.1
MRAARRWAARPFCESCSGTGSRRQEHEPPVCVLRCQMKSLGVARVCGAAAHGSSRAEWPYG